MQAMSSDKSKSPDAPHPILTHLDEAAVSHLQVIDANNRWITDPFAAHATREHIRSYVAARHGAGHFAIVGLDHKKTQMAGRVEFRVTEEEAAAARSSTRSPEAREEAHRYAVGTGDMAGLSEAAIKAVRDSVETERRLLDAQRHALAVDQRAHEERVAKMAADMAQEHAEVLERAHERALEIEERAREEAQTILDRAELRAEEVEKAAEARARRVMSQVDDEAAAMRLRAQRELREAEEERERYVSLREELREERQREREAVREERSKLTLESIREELRVQREADRREHALELEKIKAEANKDALPKATQKLIASRLVDRVYPPRGRLDEVIDFIRPVVATVAQMRGGEGAAQVAALLEGTPEPSAPGGLEVPTTFTELRQLAAEDLAAGALVDFDPSAQEAFGEVDREVAPAPVQALYDDWDGRGEPPLPPSARPGPAGVNPEAERQLRESYGGWTGEGEPPLPPSARAPVGGNGEVERDERASGDAVEQAAP